MQISAALHDPLLIVHVKANDMEVKTINKEKTVKINKI